MKSSRILLYVALALASSIVAVSLSLDLKAENDCYNLEQDIKNFSQLALKENHGIRKKRSLINFFKKTVKSVSNFFRVGSEKVKGLVGTAQKGLNKAENVLQGAKGVVDTVDGVLSFFGRGTNGKLGNFVNKVQKGIGKANEYVEGGKKMLDKIDNGLQRVPRDQPVQFNDGGGNSAQSMISTGTSLLTSLIPGVGIFDKVTNTLNAATGFAKAATGLVTAVGGYVKNVCEGIATVIDSIGNALGNIFGGGSKKKHEEVVKKLDRNYDAIIETQEQVKLVDKKVDYLTEVVKKGFEVVSNQINAVSQQIEHVSKQVDAVSQQISESTQEIRNDIQDLKQEMLKEFNKLQEVIQGVTNQIKDISKQVSENTNQIRVDINNLNKDMLKEFNKLHDALEELHVSDKISSLNTFMEYYWQQVKKNLTKIDRVFDLERRGGIIDVLQAAVHPNGDLHGNLYHILNQNLANPKYYDQAASFKALNILYLGAQTYVSIMFYLQEQYSFLANYYYFDKGDVDEYNKYFAYMSITFNNFKSVLLGKTENNGLLNQIITLIQDIRKIPQVMVNYIINNRLAEELQALKRNELIVKRAFLATISDEPAQLNSKAKFKIKPLINTPIGEWKDGKKVMYAMQYLKNGTYSKIGPWTRPYEIKQYACPELLIPRAKNGMIRLIFRKFYGELPQLVGILRNAEQTKFRDIDRDLFNVAGVYNEQLFLEDCKTLLANGANLNTTFEQGRMTLHAAAEAGNKEMFEILLQSDQFIDINVRDNKGYTTLHIAVAHEHENFVELLIEKKVDVNMKIDLSRLTALHIACSKSNEEIIESLLETNLTEINAKDKDGFTPLHSAVFGSYGRVDAVNSLLSHNEINVNAQSSAGITPLHMSVLENYPKIVEALLNCKEIDVNARSEGSYTAMHYAALTGNLKILKMLLASNEIDVNAADMNNWTALHFASSNGDESMVIELLNAANINLNPIAIDGITPLHLAANSSSNILELLLKNGAEVNAQAENGITALHIAVSMGNFHAVQTLIEYGANLELQAEFQFLDEEGQYSIDWLYLETDSKADDELHVENCVKKQSIEAGGLTVLLLAAASELTTSSILRFLIRKGANKKAKSTDDLSFEMLAALHGSSDSVKYIVDKLNGKNIKDKHLNNLLHFAVKGHNMNVIRFLIEEAGFDMNAKNRKGETPLHIASLNGDLNTVKYLIFKHANIEAENNFKSTPLHYAASCASLQTTIYLINYGGNFTKRNLYYQLPLHKAALSGNFDVARYFIREKQMSYKELDINERHSLLYAIILSNKEFITYLIQIDPSIRNKVLNKKYDNIIRIAIDRANIDIIKLLAPNCNDGSEDSLLDLAVKQCFLELIYYCLQRKANINDRNSNMLSPLHISAQYCDSNVTKFLLEKGAQIDIKDKYDRTPLHYATDSENVKILLENGASLTSLDNNGNTPFLQVVSNGDLESIKIFQKNGADIHQRNKHEDSALHIAVRSGHLQIVSYLIDEGVDVNAYNIDWNNPLHYAAIYNSHMKITKLLVEANANVNKLNRIGATPLYSTTSPILAKYLIEEAGAKLNTNQLKINLGEIVMAFKY